MARRYWTDAETEQLRALYPDTPCIEIAARLSCKLQRVYAKANHLGLEKSAAFIHRSKPAPKHTQFKKGQIPPNKGLRRPGYSIGRGRMAETHFKKGARSGAAETNWVPVGTIQTDSDGYLRIKVREAVYGQEPTGWGNPDAWPQLHRHIWAQHHGPIPAGHVVVFKNGDKQNCAIENLELISRGELARRNVMWARFPRELSLAIQAQGQLKRKLRRMHGQEQNQRST